LLNPKSNPNPNPNLLTDFAAFLGILITGSLNESTLQTESLEVRVRVGVRVRVRVRVSIRVRVRVKVRVSYI
jgi:hypothetical protein